MKTCPPFYMSIPPPDQSGPWKAWKKSVYFPTLPTAGRHYNCGKRGKGPWTFPPFPQHNDSELWKAWKRTVDFSTLPTATEEKRRFALPSSFFFRNSRADLRPGRKLVIKVTPPRWFPLSGIAARLPAQKPACPSLSLASGAALGVGRVALP